MNCTICKKGVYQTGKVTVKIEREQSILLIKDVPAEVCDQCGSYLLNSKIADLVLKTANERFASGVELEVIHLQAA